MQIRLLGGVEASGSTGEPIELGPAKCRAVLAALALSAGANVPVERVIELVWGAEAPRTADKTLQSYVTRLRKALGAELIVRVGAAYRLDLAPKRLMSPGSSVGLRAATFRPRLPSGRATRWPVSTRPDSQPPSTGWLSNGWARWSWIWSSGSSRPPPNRPGPHR